MINKVFSLVLGLAFLPAPSHASEMEDKIIDKVIDAYGGKTLMGAKGITITDFNKSLWPGQSGNPNQPDFFHDNEILTINFEKGRKSMLSWRVSRTAKDLDRFVFDGKKGRVYDLLNWKYADDNYYSYDTVGRSEIRRSDTMIARALDGLRDRARHEGQTHYHGRPHTLLAVAFGSGPTYSLYIDEATGYISKMARAHPQVGEIAYIFSSHDRKDGVAFARDMNMFVGGEARTISVRRDITINPTLEGLFDMPDGFTPWGEEVDTAELVVNTLSPGLYHAGKGRSFTLFVEAEDHFVAAGGERGLAETFEAVRHTAGSDKPLGQMIITHPHSEHLPMAREAAAMGAQLVVAGAHKEAITDSMGETAASADMVTVSGTHQLANGRIALTIINTAHAAEYLLVHIPEAGVIFAEDHYETRLKTARPRVHKDMVNFGRAVEALGIEAKLFVDGHSPRILSGEEFRAATNSYKDVTCPPGFDICTDG